METNYVIIKILDNYVLDIKDKEFIRAENKDLATRYKIKEAKKLIKPWGRAATLEEIK